MKYVTKSMNIEFRAIMNKRINKNSVVLCKVLKNGKLGSPIHYEMFGNEKTAEDVIKRLEVNNNGSKWIKA